MRILIGNCFSFAASVFMSLGAFTDKRRSMFIFQLLDCLLLAIAQLIFGVPSGAVALFLGVFRNLCILLGGYNLFAMIAFSCATLMLGLAANSSGLLGAIPIGATLLLTVGMYYARGVTATKTVIFLNLILWSVYSFLIFDFATGISNSVSAIICAITLLTGIFSREKEREHT